MKPGYKTTEFWLVVIASIIAVAQAAGYLTQEQGEAIKDASSQTINAIINLVEILAPVVLPLFYVWTRAKVKTEVAKAEAMKAEWAGRVELQQVAKK